MTTDQPKQNQPEQSINRKPNSDLGFSFEFFPPKTAQAMAGLWHCIHKLQHIKPNFFSVTYGAGGSTRFNTYSTVCSIQNITQIPVAVHLTCLGTSKQNMQHMLEDYWKQGIRHVLALRGDKAQHSHTNAEQQAEYSYPYQLIKATKTIGDFKISVAVYPEGHPEALNPQQEIDILKQKVDEGASQAITQFFFNNHLFYDYLERVRAAGINIPIIPGILPITNFAKTLHFAQKCKVDIPQKVHRTFDQCDSFDETSMQLISADFAVKQCQELVQQGQIKNFHFYSLNRAELSLAVCRMLNLNA